MSVIRAIYIDDEPALLEVTKVFLEKDGDIDLETSDNGRKALPLIERDSFDVIISDYQMPEMSGLDILKGLKSHGNATPFILFTGKGREEVAMEAINNGADFYIQKGGNPSVQFQELKNAIIKLTQKRAAEMALREREEKLRLLTDNMTDIIFEVDGHGVVRYVCPSVKTILGFDPASLIGRSTLDRVHPDDQEMVSRQFMKIGLGGPEEGATILCRYQTASGKYVWLETFGKALRGMGDQPLGYVLSSRDVTTRIEAERARLSSESKYQNIIDNANDEVIIIDQRGKVLEANKVVSHLLGYSYDELIGMDVRSIDPRSMSDGSLDPRSGERADAIVETSHIAKDGRSVPVEVSRTPIDLAGRPAVLLVARNLSERKDAERKLRDSERLLSQTQTAAHIGGYYLDLMIGAVTFTEEAYRLCGVDPLKAELGEEDYLKLGLPWDREMYTEAWWTTPERNTEFDFVYMLIVPNSGLRHLRNRGRLELDEEGNVRGIFGTIMDVTDLKRTENRLQENQRLLDEVERTSRIATFRMNWTKREFCFSEEVYHILGLEPQEEMPYKNLNEMLHPDDLTRFMEAVDKVKKGAAEVDLEYRIIKKDGSIVSLAARVRPELGPRGDVEGVRGSLMDITDRTKAEQAVRLAELKLALLGDITRSEVCQKINVLNGYLQVALNRSHDPMVRELMAKARSATRSISSKLLFNEDYMNLGQAEPAWTNLEDCCYRALSRLDVGLVKVQVDLHDQEVLADPMMEKVFYKLLENSLLHGATLDRIDVAHAVTDNGLVVTIQDNGQGISASDRAKLFNWEFRGRRGHSLHLIAEVLRLWGMSIREVGSSSSGSRFEILVPPGLYRSRTDPTLREPARTPAAI